MKKCICALLIFMIGISFIGCNKSFNTTQISEKVDTQKTTMNSSKLKTLDFNVGDTIETNDYVIELNNVFMLKDDTVYDSRSTGIGVSEGEKALILSTTITNLTNKDIYFPSGYVVVNGKYEYDFESRDSLIPLKISLHYFCASVPETLLGNVKSVDYYIYVNKDINANIRYYQMECNLDEFSVIYHVSSKDISIRDTNKDDFLK